MDVNKEDPARIGAVRGTHDGRLPAKKVIPSWPSTAGCGWILLEVLRKESEAWYGLQSRGDEASLEYDQKR